MVSSLMMALGNRRMGRRGRPAGLAPPHPFSPGLATIGAGRRTPCAFSFLPHPLYVAPRFLFLALSRACTLCDAQGFSRQNRGTSHSQIVLAATLELIPARQGKEATFSPRPNVEGWCRDGQPLIGRLEARSGWFSYDLSTPFWAPPLRVQRRPIRPGPKI